LCIAETGAVAGDGDKEVVREREFICHKITKKRYKIILNISTVAGYQIDKPSKLLDLEGEPKTWL